MDPQRQGRLAAALVDAPAPPLLNRLLDVCVDMLTLAGAAVAVIADRQHLGSLAVSDPRTAEVDELQFSLGEGPCLDANVAARPVLEPDLRAAAGTWPAFGPAALALGIAAVFAFPLGVGAARLGVLSLYRADPGDLDRIDLADAHTVARVITHVVLDLESQLIPGHLPERLAEINEHRLHVHQATGMIAAQLNSDVATALSRLRAFAWSAGRSIDDVAADVVARVLRFEPE